MHDGNAQTKHAHPAAPFVNELFEVLYISGNTPALRLEFPWLWMLLINESRVVLSDTNADANKVHAEAIKT